MKFSHFPWEMCAEYQIPTAKSTYFSKQKMRKLGGHSKNEKMQKMRKMRKMRTALFSPPLL